MQKIEEAIYARFEGSLFRCTSDASFLERFYDIFLKTSAEAASRFANVDMKRQRSVLRGSLYLIARAAGGFADGMEHLEEIARSHGEKGYDIKPAFYDHWLDSLLAAASQTDPSFDDDTRGAWVACLRPCIDLMIANSAG